MSATERERAERHLAECAECRGEARELAALGELLAAERLAPESLEVTVGQPSWARGRRPVLAAAARLAATAGLAASLFGGALAVFAGVLPRAESAAYAVATLFDFTVAVTLAGANLLDASWRSASTALSSFFQPAAPDLLFVSIFVAGLGVFLFSLLRRESSARASGAPARGRPRR